MTSACSECSPCEKFRRATSIPASINSRIISSELLAGPMVQTIFARRTVWFISTLLHLPRLGQIRMRPEQESRIAQRVELRADQDNHRNDIQPHEQRDRRRYRTVNSVVVGKAAQIHAED